MKKNKMLRIASILLVVTLLSTCVISGTFAKYVTKAEGIDAARVAKWGIIVGVEGDSAFKTEYETDDSSYPGEYSVEQMKSMISSKPRKTANTKALSASWLLALRAMV